MSTAMSCWRKVSIGFHFISFFFFEPNSPRFFLPTFLWFMFRVPYYGAEAARLPGYWLPGSVVQLQRHYYQSEHTALLYRVKYGFRLVDDAFLLSFILFLVLIVLFSFDSINQSSPQCRIVLSFRPELGPVAIGLLRHAVAALQFDHRSLGGKERSARAVQRTQW
jgi:hypothetical protein